MLHLPLHHYMTSIDRADDAHALQQLIQDLSQIDQAIKIAAIHRSVLFKEKAPRGPLLHMLKDRHANVRTAGAAAIEALKPWITDEQWLETLQKYDNYPFYQAAAQILQALGKDAPLKPFLSTLKNRYIRSFSRNILRTVIAHWSLARQDRFTQFCIEHLQHTDVDERKIAIDMLDIIDAKIPIEILLPALNDSEAYMRKAILNQFTKPCTQGDELPIEPIAALLHDPDAGVRYKSIYALTTQGERVPVALFIAAMHDTDKDVIHAAAFELGRRRSIQAIPALLAYLLTDPGELWRDYNDSVLARLSTHYEHIPLEPLLSALHSETKETRSRAIQLLYILKGRTPIELLMKLLDHKDPTTRRDTIFALHYQLTHIPIEAIVDKLKDRSKEVRKAASHVLLRSDKDIPLELLLPLLDAQENIARETAVRLAGKRIPQSLLLNMVHDHKWTVRRAAIEVLSTLGKEVPLDVFLEALCDRNLDVRKAALIVLGKQGERTPVTIIIDALYDRRRVSKTALNILKTLDKQISRKWLLQALADPMAYRRMMALELLEEIEYEEPFPVDTVRLMIQDSVARVREAAIRVLGELGVIEPIEPFIAALNDSDCNVCKASLHALTKSGISLPAEPIKALLGDSETYKSAIDCLQQSHPEVLREVAEEAVNILLRRGTGQVLGSLIQEYTVEVIGNMNNPGPLLVHKLVELLDWPYGRVRIRAKQALYRLEIEPVEYLQ